MANNRDRGPGDGTPSPGPDGSPVDEVTIYLSHGGRATVRLEPLPSSPPPGVNRGPPVGGLNWCFFSEAEAAVVLLLLGGTARTTAAIARDLGGSPHGRLRTVLAGLVDRGVLRTTGDGYAVNAPAEYYGVLRAWVEAGCAPPTLAGPSGDPGVTDR